MDRVPDGFEAPGATLRRLRASDALAIYEGYARDPQVTRYLSWRPPRSLAETAAFLASTAEAAAAGRGHVSTPSCRRARRRCAGRSASTPTAVRCISATCWRAATGGAD